MKKILLLAALLAPVIALAQKAGYQITATFPALNPQAKAYLVANYGWTNYKKIDSATLLNGTFYFKKSIEEPQKVALVIEHTGNTYNGWKKGDDITMLYVENGPISIKGTDSATSAKVIGGTVNADYSLYNSNVILVANKWYKAIQSVYLSKPIEQRKDPETIKWWNKEYAVASKKMDSLKYKFIKENPKSFISLVALTEVAGNDIDVAKIDPIYKTLAPKIKDTPLAKQFALKLYENGPTAVGKMAPNFTQDDVNGKAVKLSDFKGKYVLLDFWASWCGSCRAENPNVLAAYNKYKDRNFTVLGVSLDQPGKKEAWLAAIAKDGLTWTQLSDLKFWDNAVSRQYKISSIPQNFLIGPNGKIIAKNLRGEKLEEKLKQLLQ